MALHCDVAPQWLRRSQDDRLLPACARKRTDAVEHEEDEEELYNN